MMAGSASREQGSGAHDGGSRAPIGFDGWLVYEESRELARDGRRIRLQEQPLQLLLELLAHPGAVVTREQLIARLWPKGVVDFDVGLNAAVRRLRTALGDEAETPRYIETIPRRGYRFIGTIDVPTRSSSESDGERITEPSVEQTDCRKETQVEQQAPSFGTAPRSRRTHIYVGVVLLTAIVAGGALFFERLSRRQPTAATSLLVTAPTMLNSRGIAILPFRSLTPDASEAYLSRGVAEMIRESLAGSKELVVIGSNSAFAIPDSLADMRAIAEKIDARYLLQGSVAKTGDRLRVTAQLVDAQSEHIVWTLDLEGLSAELPAIQRQIADRAAEAMQVTLSTTGAQQSLAREVDPNAYSAYMRGRALLASRRVADTQMAIDHFVRVTTLEPRFAAAHAALGRALIQISFLNADDPTKRREQIIPSIDRALKLDSSLGAAWIARAMLEDKPDIAEPAFRKGLDLAPNDGSGYSAFSEFLWDNDRRGEAIEMIDRARQLDPLTPRHHYLKGLYVGIAHGDLEQCRRLMLQTLKIDPDFHPALVRLSWLTVRLDGKYAEAVKLVERALQLDPQAAWVRDFAVMIYLDVEDADAARRVLAEPSSSSLGSIDIALFERDWQAAASLANEFEDWPYADDGSFAGPPEALRDHALRTADYSNALRILGSQAPNAPTGSGWPISKRAIALVYAHTLILSGQAERGRQLAKAILAQLDAEEIGRAQPAFCWNRAVAFAMLGENERAVASIQACAQHGDFIRSWYSLEIDPVFDAIRQDPRFQAIAREAKSIRARERILVDAMRSRGEIPNRG